MSKFAFVPQKRLTKTQRRHFIGAYIINKRECKLTTDTVDADLAESFWADAHEASDSVDTVVGASSVADGTFVDITVS